MIKFKTALLIAAFIISPPMASAAKKAKKDVKGSQDHPLVQRYKDTRIKAYSYIDFEEYKLVEGVKERGQPTPTKKIEGEITTIIYETKDNSESALKVLRNFELALQKSGAKELYACNNTECGRGMPKDVFGNKQVSKRYIKADPWNMGNSINYHFWNGKLDKNGRTTYINLIVSNKNFGNYPVTITLDIVEVAEMESNLVALNPDYIKDQLKEFGKVVLSGIVFDTNKTTLKVESNTAIKIIADYLKANSDEKAYIVGHTDNQGSYNHNLQLSKGRANTVVGALISQHNISKKRLSSIGIADVSPAASNANEISRAKNRRVEMVLQ